MNASRFKTMRHMETVRNLLQEFTKNLLDRGVAHDQSKLREPEDKYREKYMLKLRRMKYGSSEYNRFIKKIGFIVQHHHKVNSHHPEFYKEGIRGMTLMDVMEMLCDWKAATLREDNNIFTSIDMAQKKYLFTDELKAILINTALWLNDQDTFHRADES